MEAQQDQDDTIDHETEPETPSNDPELTRDDIFHVLQCRRRRLVLKYLQEYEGDGPARMGDIAEHIAALEHDTTVNALRSQQRQRVYIALYQSHLPKMDEDGVIEYNQSRGYVEATDRAEQFHDYLDCEPSLLGNGAAGDETEPTPAPEETAQGSGSPTRQKVRGRWHKRYLYAAGGCILALGMVPSAITSSFVPSNVGAGILVSLLFLLMAVSHWMTESSMSQQLMKSSAVQSLIR